MEKEKNCGYCKLHRQELYDWGPLVGEKEGLSGVHGIGIGVGMHYYAQGMFPSCSYS